MSWPDGRYIQASVFFSRWLLAPFLLGLLVFHLRLPHHAWTWPAFVLSATFAACVSFGFRFMLNLSAFWLLDYRGAGTIMTAAWTFLSGFVVPIAFFPGALQTVARALPFAALVNGPVEVFLEKQQGLDLLGALLLQAMWAATLLLAGRLMLAGATRKVVVQGG